MGPILTVTGVRTICVNGRGFMSKESVIPWCKFCDRAHYCGFNLSGFSGFLSSGVRPFGAATFVLLASFSLAFSGHAATLRTDKPDYIPGEHVIFSGTGWKPG